MTTTPYNLVARILHWAIAILIFWAIGLGLIAEDMPNSPDKIELFVLHKSAGFTVLVLAVIRATSDLERIGDEASKIARNALLLSENSGGIRGLVEVRHISEHVRKMLRDALTAFARFDTELAMQVVREDESVDDEYGSAMRSLMTFMMEDSRSISSVLSIMWVLRALERVGDHANNLAEYVVYLVKGLDIRHSDPDTLEQKVLKKS